MASLSPTYVFDGTKISAFDGDRVIASGTDYAKVASDAETYFNELRNVREKKNAEAARKSATHVTTPNGQKGVVLGRTSSVFSDEGVTVRFDNGQIRHYDTFVGLKFSNEADAIPESPVAYFQSRLEEPVVETKAGLTARLNLLDEVRSNASHLAGQGVSYKDALDLHKVVLAANTERFEIEAALDHLNSEDVEAYMPPTRAYAAVEQASMGRSDDWLEVVAKQIIAESEGEDWDQFLQEGPTKFVSSLNDGLIAQAGVVADLALEHVVAKTAAFQGPEVEEYRDRFVAGAELARRRETSLRQEKKSKKAQKTAKKEKKLAKQAPDEALFL